MSVNLSVLDGKRSLDLTASKPRVTDAELAILQELWQHGPETIGQLTDALYPERTAPQYATVQKLLERLEAKGCVKRDRAGRAHRFAATVSREDFIGGQLQSLADRLCGGSLTPLLTQLIDERKLSKRDLESLRALLDELSRTSPRGKRRR